MIKKNWLSFTLWFSIGIIWLLLYSAKHLKYDENIASVLLAFLLSVAVSILLIIFLFKRKESVRKSKFSIFVFVLTSSPYPVYWVVFNFEWVFGTHLDVS